jgi:hypothetical protein
MDRRLDPRSIVTPYAFSVHPDLLGVPLATPWQRLGAILLDLVVIGLISRVGWETLGFLTTGLLLWLAIRKPVRDTLGKVFRVAVGCLGVSVLGITILVIVVVQFKEPLIQMAEGVIAEMGEEGDPVEGEAGGGARETGAEAPEAEFGIREGVAAFGEILALGQASTEEEAVEAAETLARAGLAAGLSAQEIRSSIEGFIPDDAPWAERRGRIAEEALAPLLPALPPAPSPSEGDSAPPPEGVPAWTADPEVADSIAALEGRIRGLEAEVHVSEEALAGTRQQLAQTEDRGVFDWLWSLIDDLGLGFGWAALYMTITHAPGLRMGGPIHDHHPRGVAGNQRGEEGVRDQSGHDRQATAQLVAVVRAGWWVCRRVRHGHAGFRTNILGPQPSGHP